MIFASQEFIFLFAPLAIITYWLLPYQYRLHWLTATSYFFYGWWDWRFCLLMLASTAVDYFVGMYIPQGRTQRHRRGLLLVSIAVNIGLLGFFKYAGFMGESINAILGFLKAGGPLPVLEVILPIGISFYTFQSLSYTMDVYREKVQPTKSFLHFATFVSLFPQLIAGPVVRFSQLDFQLRNLPKTLSPTNLNLGLVFFACGLVKKTLIADRVAYFGNQLLVDYSRLSPGDGWAAALGSSVQWYFDFSGYSLMAVGLAYLIGLKLPQNFNSPYRADNISEFWRRWHISLSSWLRDYLYHFLGGRNPNLRPLALVGTMFLAGLWHGAAWTYVIFGLLHGMFLMIHHTLRRFKLGWYGGWLGRIGTMLLFTLSLVVFVSDDMQTALVRFGRLIDFSRFAEPLDSPVIFYVMVLVGIGWAMLAPNLYSWVHEHQGKPTRLGLAVLGVLAAVAVLFLSDTSPFLYYQF